MDSEEFLEKWNHAKQLIEDRINDESITSEELDAITKQLVKLRNSIAEAMLSYLEEQGNLDSSYDEILKLANINLEGDNENVNNE